MPAACTCLSSASFIQITFQQCAAGDVHVNVRQNMVVRRRTAAQAAQLSGQRPAYPLRSFGGLLVVLGLLVAVAQVCAQADSRPCRWEVEGAGWRGVVGVGGIL